MPFVRIDVAGYLPVDLLVAWAFHGPPKPGESAVHVDGDLSNCMPENLRYETDAEREFEMFDRMMRDPGFPLSQGRNRFTVWH